MIKQTIRLSCIPQDKTINDGTLSWQYKTCSVRPHLDSYGLGLCVSEWYYYITMVQQSTNTLIQVLGDTAYEKTHPQLSKIFLKHLAVGSNRKEAAEKWEVDRWELVASLLRESRGDDRDWDKMRRRNSTYVFWAWNPISGGGDEISWSQRVKEIHIINLGGENCITEKSSHMKLKTVAEDGN